MGNVVQFSELNKSDISSAGGKGANLGELTQAGLSIPTGFVVTTAVYDSFVQTHNLQQQIVELAKGATDPNPAKPPQSKSASFFYKLNCPKRSPKRW